ncbi:MAG: hypothetical protein AUF79_09700 [Crenarchaeota archaeon 13_1_20CM_2_51_8]|nr:MAG: hypothetical protein AUF79_09700 [Crenarchaeota archaeon 13_1_20CM_2_51_8]
MQWITEEYSRLLLRRRGLAPVISRRRSKWRPEIHDVLPLLEGAAMEFGPVNVVSNSLLRGRFTPPLKEVN